MAEPPETSVRVGHGVATFPVPAGTALGGYADRPGPSTGVLDAPRVGAVALLRTEHPRSTVVWCVADLPFAPAGLADACRAAVAASVATDVDLVWFSATHTHAGPDTTDPDRVETLTTAAVQAAVRAVADARPATVGLHRGMLHGVGGQRSGAARRTTVPVAALRFADPASQEPFGLLGVVPVHPTVLPADNLLASADLNGGIRRALSTEGSWSEVATGAAGDVSTRPHRRDQTSTEVDRLGRLAAEQLLAVADGPEVALLDPSVPFTGSSTVLRLRRKAAADPEAREAVLADARDRLRLAADDDDPVAEREAFVALQGAELADDAAGDDGPVSCAVAALDLGGLHLYALGGEPFVALADVAVRDDPAGVLVGYTNGYCGYLPVEDAFARDDYEVLISPVAPGESERALAAALNALPDPSR